MSANTLTCPQCKSSLQFPKALPPGLVVKCPQCQASLRIPAAAPAAAVAAAKAPAPPDKIAPSARSVAPPMASPPTAGIAVETARLNRSRKTALVVVIGLTLLALAAVAIVWCFWGDGMSNAVVNGSQNGGVDVPLPPISPKGKAKTSTLSKEKQDKRDEMVRKGVAYLKGLQNPDGSWGAGDQIEKFTPFAAMTLLECGVPRNDPVIQKSLKYLRGLAVRCDFVYSMSLLVLFFDKLNEPQDEPLIKLLSMRLLAGQGPEGGWGYHVPLAFAPDIEKLHGFLNSRPRTMRGLVDYASTKPADLLALPGAFQTAGIFVEVADKNPEFFRQGGDNSNTQFALLALWAARRHKLPVEASLERIVYRFRKIQNEDGTFSYEGRNIFTPYPSMTCAGLLAMAVDYGLAEKKKGSAPLDDPMIQKALHALGKSIGDPIPESSGSVTLPDSYFLWSVERVGVLYSLEAIQGRGWFAWGFSLLAASQTPEGSWEGRDHRGPLVDTCFALLFLQEVNLTSDLTDKLTEFVGSGAASTPSISKKD